MVARNQSPGSIKVFLAGQPNAGKSAIFNRLTGSSTQVANYPGVTVERHHGQYDFQGTTYEVLDLPGSYSLSSYSPEERVAEEELLTGEADVVVVVVDSTTLRRSLVFLAQVMQLGVRPILCLNMSDEAERSGLRLDLKQMASLLGFPVIPTVGHRGQGLDELRLAVATRNGAPKDDQRLLLGERTELALSQIGRNLIGTGLNSHMTRWVATRLLAGDPLFQEKAASEGAGGKAALDEADRQRCALESDFGQDIPLILAERYAGFVDGLLRQVVLAPSRDDARRNSDRLDAWLAHRVLGLPLFGLIMFAVFWITFTLGEVPMGLIEGGFENLAAWLSSLWPADSQSALRSLLVDGVVGGVGGVIVFLPNILLLFLGLTILEDSGYMARAAHLMDKLMHRFGLHGKSFLPMLTGFGCSIPGIMATRTLENEKDRLITMLVLPLMSCGARLPIWMLLVPAFFPSSAQAPMLWGIYALGVVLALLLARLLRSSLFKGDEAPFVMELPPYRMPTLRALSARVRERSWLYLRKAGTIILAISIIMWFLTSYPKPPPHTPAGASPVTPASATLDAAEAYSALEYSAAGRLGKALEPIFAPLGFDWRMNTALVGAFAAKEVFVAQMGIITALGELDESSSGLRQVLARDYSPLVGLSLMIFLLVGTPCMATVAVTRRESGRWKWALLQFFGLTALAYVMALVVYQVGSLFG